jgi:hypothetical protein
MSVLLRSSVIFAAIAAVVMLLSKDSDPGKPVSDALCAQLRGGCPGHTVATCTNIQLCSNNGYIVSGMDDGTKPDGQATTYCEKTLNGKQVCNDSMQSWDSCGG